MRAKVKFHLHLNDSLAPSFDRCVLKNQAPLKSINRFCNSQLVQKLYEVQGVPEYHKSWNPKFTVFRQ